MSIRSQIEPQPSIFQVRMGGFQVTTLLDSRIVRAGLSPTHGGEAMAQDVRKLAQANRIAMSIPSFR